MNPEVWGPHLWKSIHYIALALPLNPSDDIMSKYHSFYTQLHYVIPCYTCAIEYKKLLHEYPLTIDKLRNSSELFAWTVEIHNRVNDRIGKPRLTLEQARAALQKTKSNLEKKKTNQFVTVDTSPPYTNYDSPIQLIEASLLICAMMLILRNIQSYLK